MKHFELRGETSIFSSTANSADWQREESFGKGHIRVAACNSKQPITNISPSFELRSYLIFDDFTRYI